MVVALVTLAVLQYHWLGSVSDAEKKRLEENLEASAENFVSDLNRGFSSLNQAFKIQISSGESEVKYLLEQSYLNWLSTAEYPQLVDSVFFVEDVYGSDPVVNIFNTDPARLIEIQKAKHISNWIDKQKSPKRHASNSFDLIKPPEFGDPTLIAIPVQLLDLITVENESSGKNMQVSLNIDQGDDVVLLQLDDEIIKNEIIPGIAQTYFSESYTDQYHISIVKEDADSSITESVYFTTSEGDEIPIPDYKKKLRKFDFSSVFIIQADADETGINPLLRGIDSLSGNLQSIEINNKSNAATTMALNSETRRLSYKTSSKDSTFTVKRDTTINASFSADFTTAGWQFWLSFKEGSLDAFVSKAKNRNLAISFGILVILGFCVGMIVLFSKRSQDLADQQMLFVAGVSHELRTPLTVIRSAAENLNEGVIQSEERKKEYARLMLKEGRRLSEMVDQIMEFSGIQAGKRVYSFTEVEIEGLMNEILNKYKPILESEGIQLEYSFTTSKSIIKADRDALYLSISNLLNNAIKFRGDSKKIRVSVAETSKQDFITVIVKDYGIGIPSEEQKKIFEPFFRGKKPVEDQVKGNGIGLSLVKKVAEAHKGEIRLKSKEGEGSTFILILPVKEDE